MKKDALVKNIKYATSTFTAVCYTKEGHCITSTADGKLLLWENCLVIKEAIISENNTAIHNLTYSNVTEKIYATDSNKKVFIIELNKQFNTYGFNIVFKFTTDSFVKAFDINQEGEMALGLRDGSIIIKDIKKDISRILTRSHYDGKVCGLEYVPDNYILTTGEDNRVMLWNMNTKICEDFALLNENKVEVGLANTLTKGGQKIIDINSSQHSNLTTSKTFSPYGGHKHFADNQCSQCVSYNVKFDHVAIGLNSGFISIRKKKLLN
jgi:WD40 repeat protein